jgi:hypothetical protein
MRLAGALLVIVILVVVLLLALVQRVPTSAPEEREDHRLEQLKAIMPEEKARKFIEKYGFLAVDSKYNETVLNFAKVFNIDENLANYILSNKNLKDSSAVILASKNETLLKEIHRNSLFDENVKNKYAQTESASRLILELNYANDFVKVYDPATESYVLQKLKKETIQMVGNYTRAIDQLNLPLHSKNDIWLMGNATQINKDIFDFEPLVFYSVDGNNIVLKWNISKDTWEMVEFLKNLNSSGFKVLKHPEAFEAINMKIKTNILSIFDYPFGVADADKRMNRREIKITDKDVQDLIMLQWTLYNKAKEEKIYNKDFPWWNSTKLRELYPDNNTRKQALYFLFKIDPSTWDIRKEARPDVTSKDYTHGIEGAKLSLTQAYYLLQKISSLYPDGKLWRAAAGGDVDLRWYFYDLLSDRAWHGVNNTLIQFVGVDVKSLDSILYTHPFDFDDYLMKYKGVSQHLTNTWKEYNVIKSILSCMRYSGAPEQTLIYFLNPQVLRMAGFPNQNIVIDLDNPGLGGVDFGFSLPNYVVKSIKEKFPSSKILFGPANIFGFYSMGDGLEKDGAKKVWIWIDTPEGPGRIYLMKEA